MTQRIVTVRVELGFINVRQRPNISTVVDAREVPPKDTNFTLPNNLTPDGVVNVIDRALREAGCEEYKGPVMTDL